MGNPSSSHGLLEDIKNHTAVGKVTISLLRNTGDSQPSQAGGFESWNDANVNQAFTPEKAYFQVSQAASFSQTGVPDSHTESGEGRNGTWLARSSGLVTKLILHFLHRIRETAWTDEQFWC